MTGKFMGIAVFCDEKSCRNNRYGQCVAAIIDVEGKRCRTFSKSGENQHENAKSGTLGTKIKTIFP